MLNWQQLRHQKCSDTVGKLSQSTTFSSDVIPPHPTWLMKSNMCIFKWPLDITLQLHLLLLCIKVLFPQHLWSEPLVSTEGVFMIRCMYKIMWSKLVWQESVNRMTKSQCESYAIGSAARDSNMMNLCPLLTDYIPLLHKPWILCSIDTEQTNKTTCSGR